MKSHWQQIRKFLQREFNIVYDIELLWAYLTMETVLEYSGVSKGMSIAYEKRWQGMMMGVFWGVLM